ncbi:MAG TPA: GNAT family N-acetyltransferase [Flavobacterium sp.]|jgi:GNAT superfamily N-acetyltransferase
MITFREATPEDIPKIQVVRHTVKENTLSNPGLVTDQDCFEFITNRGKGWVAEINEEIVGFAIADLQDENIWALFVKPEFEGQGIGKHLQQIMLQWYFAQGKIYVWLGTAPNTRAALFYRKSGWTENGTNGPNEIKFEMHKNQYENERSS